MYTQPRQRSPRTFGDGTLLHYRSRKEIIAYSYNRTKEKENPASWMADIRHFASKGRLERSCGMTTRADVAVRCLRVRKVLLYLYCSGNSRTRTLEVFEEVRNWTGHSAAEHILQWSRRVIRPISRINETPVGTHQATFVASKSRRGTNQSWGNHHQEFRGVCLLKRGLVAINHVQLKFCSLR
jgi:hypothetical protein